MTEGLTYRQAVSTRRKISTAILGAVTTLSLAACGAGDSATTSASSAPTSPEVVLDEADCADAGFYVENEEFCANVLPGGPVDTEGSVTTEDGSFIAYPDGLRITIQEVTTQADDGTRSMDDKPDWTQVVTVTVLLENTGTEAIPLMSESSPTLLFGANRYEANAWMTSGGASDLPQQLVPGSSATITTDYTLPAEGLEVLALTVSPDPSTYTSYTFTDVETLVR